MIIWFVRLHIIQQKPFEAHHHFRGCYYLKGLLAWHVASFSVTKFSQVEGRDNGDAYVVNDFGHETSWVLVSSAFPTISKHNVYVISDFILTVFPSSLYLFDCSLFWPSDKLYRLVRCINMFMTNESTRLQTSVILTRICPRRKWWSCIPFIRRGIVKRR